MRSRKRCTIGLVLVHPFHHKCPAKAQYHRFMAAASENRRRGRPRAFSQQELSDVEGRSSLSERQRQNRAYAERARRRLGELWWWDSLSGGRSVPQCVLTELGRIEDDATFTEAAWWYVFFARNLKAKQVSAEIKRMRTGKTPQVGPATLYKRLMKEINDFRISYPDTTLLYVEGQVRLALDTVRRFRR